MRNFFIKTLQKLQHAFPHKPQYAPHQWAVPTYDHHRQYVKPPDTSNFLDKVGIQSVQSVVGSFLYYGRAIDNTILVVFNNIAASQAAPTEEKTKRPDVIGLSGNISRC